MSTRNEQAEIDTGMLVLETAAAMSQNVSLKLDAWLTKRGYNTPAAETFIPYLSTQVPKKGESDETRFINLIKKLLPESKWATEPTKEFMENFMTDKEGYGSPLFTKALKALKEDNEKALKNLTGSLNDAPDLVDAIAFERFFAGTSIQFLHTALPVLEVKEMNEKGEIKLKDNRIQPCISAFTGFTANVHNVLSDCVPLMNDLGEIQSGYLKAKSNRVENLPDVLPLLIATQAGVAKNGETLFAQLCEKYKGDEELSAVADMFHTVSAPLQNALPPQPSLVVHVEESSVLMHMAESPKSTIMDKIEQSGPALDAALAKAAGKVADKASDTASKVADKARRASNVFLTQFSPKTAAAKAAAAKAAAEAKPAPNTPPVSPSSGKKPGAGA
jgi:hypothetical protein